MGQLDYVFGQLRETVRCRDAQHRDGVCCALAPQLLFKVNFMWVKIYLSELQLTSDTVRIVLANMNKKSYS